LRQKAPHSRYENYILTYKTSQDTKGRKEKERLPFSRPFNPRRCPWRLTGCRRISFIV